MAAAVVGTSEVDDLKDVSGITDKEIEYVKARQFTSVKLFAKAGLDERDFVTKIVQPYIAGVVVGGHEHKLEDDRDAAVCEASLLVAWEESRSIRTRELGGGGAAAPLAAISHGVSGSIHGTTACPKARPPGGLDNAVFVAGVERWQKQWTPAQTFPKKMVIGAEEVLYKLHSELNTTRVFTPLLLGDVVSTRTYNADESINERRNTRKGRQSQLDQLTSAVGAAVGAELPTLQHDENAQLFVDSVLAAGDALEANMWALRWAQYGTDPQTDKWRRFWLNKARGDKIDGNMKVFTVVYTAAAWRVATLMRDGQAWHESAAEVEADKDWIKDEIDKAKYRNFAYQGGGGKGGRSSGDTQSGGRSRSRGRSRRADRSRSRRQHRPIGASNRDWPTTETRYRQAQDQQDQVQERRANRTAQDQQQRDVHRDSVSPNGRPICRNFNQGMCKLADEKDRNATGRRCKHSHVCWQCRERCGDGAKFCRNTAAAGDGGGRRGGRNEGRKGSGGKGRKGGGGKGNR